MADIFGVDIAQTDVQDWGTTSQGDLALVAGVDNLHQALERRWATPYGALFYAPDYGNTIFDMLSEPITPDWIERAIVAARSCILADPRVADVQVTVTPFPEKRIVHFLNKWVAVDGSSGQFTGQVTVGV
ncbi:hypothetical protein DNHGIG_15160 [Collibacillus ludicampi]|uniref:DUF2634 domain-containing protein n=1 Tax=Collibacillus ludicampi TaxID=2771369 RepID=A0AAV4LDP3_9BACL|nr:hypothetical protein [Collibacillus ludicampi]GIM45967.1 hypothetical protein DNHGIG_15160 [Collibacillus ludicampi]